MDCVDPLIARVSRRAEGLANLTLDSAEDLQVFQIASNMSFFYTDMNSK